MRSIGQCAPEGLDLLMVGRSVMDLPSAPWLDPVGFVSDEEKQALIAGAVALVSASPYESLSLVLFEAWAEGTPTLVSTTSDVLVGQTQRAGGGLWFRDAYDYVAALDLLTARPAVAGALGASGRRVARALTWDIVTDRLIDAIPGMPARVDAGDIPPAAAAGGPVVMVPGPMVNAAMDVLGMDMGGRMLVGVGMRPAETPVQAWVSANDPALATRVAVVDAVVAGDPTLDAAAAAAGVPVLPVTDLPRLIQAT